MIPESIFDDYLEDNMSQKERSDFELRLKREVTFNENFERYKEEKVAIEAFFLKQELASNKDHIVKNQGKSRTLILIVLAILIMVLSLFWILQSFKKPQSDFLIADHYIPHQGLPVTMSSDNKNDFLDGMIDYKSQNLEDAIRKWKELKKESSNDTLSFFLASALVQDNQIKEALPLLKALQNKPSIFSNEAEWIFAICNYSQGNKEYLKNISRDSQNPYYQKAKKILLDESKE